MTFQASVLQVETSPAAMQDYFEAQGWTDGLPVVPPTPDLVAAMVDASGLSATTEVARIAPGMTSATVEKVAINAVMAGCRPAYMAVVLAALRALARREFNLAGVQGTTHPASPMLLVNGPVRQRIGLNCGSNVFGQGFRANATIGGAAGVDEHRPGPAGQDRHGDLRIALQIQFLRRRERREKSLGTLPC